MSKTYRDVLLISEDYVRSHTNADFNLSGTFILAAIKSAQDIELRSILGDCLLEALQQKVFDEEIDSDENTYYKDLLDYYVQDFLAMQVLADVIIPASYKIANGGLLQYSDDRLNHTDNADLNLIRHHYINKAAVYKKRMQSYLCKNKSKYPELGDCCDTNLYASDAVPLWLGGRRSRIIRKRCCK